MNSILVSSLVKTPNVRVLPGGRMGTFPHQSKVLKMLLLKPKKVLNMLPSPPDGRFLGSF